MTTYFSPRIVSLIAFFSSQTRAFAQHIDLPFLVPRVVETVFSPSGFDDNDNVEVILQGRYDSSCYSNGPISVSVDAEAKIISIDAESYFHIGAPCHEMGMTYVQPVKIGFLPTGTYEVRVAGNPRAKLTPLVIKASERESQDDYMYAQVQAAYITNDAEDRQSLNLVGTFPKVAVGCLTLKNVNIDYAPGKVLVVQPIMQLRDGWVCNTAAAQPSFTYSTELPVALKKNHLIHVRSANGDSINTLYQ